MTSNFVWAEKGSECIGLSGFTEPPARIASCMVKGPPGGLDVEVLDHPAVVGDYARSGAAPPCLGGCRGRPPPLLRRGEGGVGVLHLAGVDQRLAVEAHLPSLPTFKKEALGVLHVVVDTVEDRLSPEARAARSETTSPASRLAARYVLGVQLLTSTVSRSTEHTTGGQGMY